MPRRYETPNYGLSGEPPTSQEEAVRRLEEQAAIDLPPMPRATSAEESETRLAQFLDEDDHQKCVEGNKNALLAEKLDRLRALKDEIAKEDWMFDSNSSVNPISMSGWKSGS